MPDAPTSATPPLPLLAGEPAGPVTEAQRIVSLDVLRGFAVLGILVMNIQSFSMIGAAYMNPTAYGDLAGANFGVWYFGHLLVDLKFMTIFSMLFGAGIIVMASRREATGRGSAGLHYRRMGWLLVFGLLHAYLLWYGDILYSYAVCGLLIFLLRKLPPWLLLLIGIGAAAVTSGIEVFSGLTMPLWPQEAVTGFKADAWLPPPEAVDAEVAAYRGNWLEQMSHRAPTAFEFQTFLMLVFISKHDRRLETQSRSKRSERPYESGPDSA